MVSPNSKKWSEINDLAQPLEPLHDGHLVSIACYDYRDVVVVQKSVHQKIPRERDVNTLGLVVPPVLLEDKRGESQMSDLLADCAHLVDWRLPGCTIVSVTRAAESSGCCGDRCRIDGDPGGFRRELWNSLGLSSQG